MNLFHSITGRVWPGRRRVGRHLVRSGRLYNIRYSITPRGLRREEVGVRIRPLIALWTRHPVTGLLARHWQIAPAQRVADASSSITHKIICMPRRDMRADMRPPSR